MIGKDCTDAGHRSDRASAIINGLQGGFPLTPRPFRDAGAELGLSEGELIEGVRDLVGGRASEPLRPAVECRKARRRRLPRAPWRCRRSGSTRSRSRSTPIPKSPTITSARHALNMWFVVSAERPATASREVIARNRSGNRPCRSMPMPKLREFFVGFRVEV